MSEAQAAKDYWWSHHVQSPRVVPRGGDQDYRYLLAEHIAGYAPSSVLEFGCSSGRNLAVLRESLPDAELVGIDGNEGALSVGRAAHPTIRYVKGDESLLAQAPDGAYDVVFTCSVLDHIPTPQWEAVYRDLARLAGKALVLLEPLLPSPYGYGADYADVDIATTPEIKAPPFTYAHSYPDFDPALRVLAHVPIPGLNWPGFGELYHLMARATR